MISFPNSSVVLSLSLSLSFSLSLFLFDLSFMTHTRLNVRVFLRYGSLCRNVEHLELPTKETLCPQTDQQMLTKTVLFCFPHSHQPTQFHQTCTQEFILFDTGKRFPTYSTTTKRPLELRAPPPPPPQQAEQQ